MKSYPQNVMTEAQTLALALDGFSIARYGDGEFNLVRGGNCISQRAAPGLRLELTSILINRDPRLLVCIPRLDPRSPKYPNWQKVTAPLPQFLDVRMQYGSAFITRPDSAPWIATDEFYADIERLWKGRDIVMVYGSERSLSAEFPAMASAKSIKVVRTPYSGAYDEIDRIEAEILATPGETVLLMCGPTATCLAARLAMQGRHAVDLGHIGMWWMAHKNPKLIPQLKERTP